MKTLFAAMLILVVCATAVLPSAQAATKANKDQPSVGLEAARAVTTITGVAISPLLGVAVIGAVDWFQGRNSGVWYTRPWFWIPALLLCLAVAAKDLFGTALPPGLKKPLDVAETIENKISGIVVAGAFVPLIGSIFGSQSGGSAMMDVAPVVGFEWASLLNIFTIPLAVAAFLAVWLCGHVINVLILISPFGAVDAALKAFRTSLMAFLAAVHLINPWLGALLSLIIVIICALIAGWAFRFMVFGAIFSWDFLTFRRKRFSPEPNANWMFTARRIEKAPIRTYGKLIRGEENKLTFEYRPWLVLPKRTVTLPERKYTVGRGMFFPEILTMEGEKKRTMLLLPPRYQSHEEAIASIYNLGDVQDVGLLKGLKAFWRWLKSLLGFGARVEGAAPA